jgi:hypothetical protein
LYVFLNSSMRATCPAHVILLNLTFLIIGTNYDATHYAAIVTRLQFDVCTATSFATVGLNLQQRNASLFRCAVSCETRLENINNPLCSSCINDNISSFRTHKNIY